VGVDIERHGPAVVVTIDRPERRNALDADTRHAIGAAFAAAEVDDDVRAVILTGAGDIAFSAGADLRDAGTPRPGEPGIEIFTNRCYPKPVIAAVNGLALGAGFEMVLASDLVVAAVHATFGIPEAKRGLVGAGCSTRLSARVPPVVAYEMGLVGDVISATRALELDLVNQVVPLDQVLPASLALAERIAANAPLAVRVTKEIMWREMGMHDDAEWRDIRAAAVPVFASEDAAEGRAAFAEKRAPAWKGR
jgi:enoyl-CoA hydratase